MENIIKITTNEEGSNVVSARELYDFLGYETANWKRWAIKNIEDNQFAIQNEDWSLLVIKMSENKRGNFGNDYALTLDFSKRLSMMARTEKGEQARNYFLACEKQAIRPKTQIEALLESVQMLATIEQKQNSMDLRLSAIEQSKEIALSQLNYIERSTNEVPEIGLRLKINKIVRAYGDKTSIAYSDIWNKMYDKMLYAYRFNVNAYKKLNAKESKMDIFERENQLDNLFALVSRELV